MHTNQSCENFEEKVRTIVCFSWSFNQLIRAMQFSLYSGLYSYSYSYSKARNLMHSPANSNFSYSCFLFSLIERSDYLWFFLQLFMVSKYIIRTMSTFHCCFNHSFRDSANEYHQWAGRCRPCILHMYIVYSNMNKKETFFLL